LAISLFSNPKGFAMRTRKERSAQAAKEFFLEQAAAYYDELKIAAQNAPYGQTFDHAEAFAVQQGRELIRQSLQTLLQEQIDEIEKKKKRNSVRNAKRKNGIAATAPKKE
jgi:hypothetical protein